MADEANSRKVLNLTTELHLWAKAHASFNPKIEDQIHRLAGKIRADAYMSRTLKKLKVVVFLKSTDEGFSTRRDIEKRFGWSRRDVERIVAEMLNELPSRIEEFALPTNGPKKGGRPAMRLRAIK